MIYSVGVAITPEEITQTLTDLTPQIGGADIRQEGWDRMSAAVREAMIGCGLDPSDMEQLKAYLLGSYMAFKQMMQNAMVIGPAPQVLWCQAMIVNKWVTGELPMPTSEFDVIFSLSDIACGEVVAWPTGRGSSGCLRTLGHQMDGEPHKVRQLVEDQGAHRIVEVDVPL